MNFIVWTVSSLVPEKASQNVPNQKQSFTFFGEDWFSLNSFLDVFPGTSYIYTLTCGPLPAQGGLKQLSKL